MNFDRVFLISGKRWLLYFGRYGFTFRVNEGKIVCFRTPWHKALFSERNGYVRHIFKFCGFRFWIDPR